MRDEQGDDHGKSGGNVRSDHRAPTEGDEASGKKVQGRGGEGRPDDLLKPEVTNFPNANDTKVNAALEKVTESAREREGETKKSPPLSPPPTAEASSEVVD